MLHRWFISHFQLLQFDINLHVKIISSFAILNFQNCPRDSFIIFTLRLAWNSKLISNLILSSRATSESSKNRWESNKRGGGEEEGRHNRKRQGARGRCCACTNHAKNDEASARSPSHLRDETRARCPYPSPSPFLSFSSSHLPSLPRGCAPPYTVVTLVCIIEVAYEACRREDRMLHQPAPSTSVRSFVAYYNNITENNACVFVNQHIVESHL